MALKYSKEVMKHWMPAARRATPRFTISILAMKIREYVIGPWGEIMTMNPIVIIIVLLAAYNLC